MSFMHFKKKNSLLSCAFNILIFGPMNNLTAPKGRSRTTPTCISTLPGATRAPDLSEEASCQGCSREWLVESPVLTLSLLTSYPGKELPTELRKMALETRKDLAFDAAQQDPLTSVDYEYSRAGIRDPKIVITTSRDPSSKLLQFAKVRFYQQWSPCLSSGLTLPL